MEEEEQVRQLPEEYWEMLREGRVEEFHQHAIGFVLTCEQYGEEEGKREGRGGNSRKEERRREAK